MLSNSRRGLLGMVVLVVLPVLALFVGCGKEEEVDPYVYGSLDQVTRGFIQSKQYLFEVDAPQFVFIQGNTGIARSGNHLEVIVADNLENRAPSWGGKLIGVQKFYSPYVWLMAKRVKDGVNITALDSVQQPVLPHFTSVKLDEVSGYDIGQLRWNQKKKIDDMVDAEVQTVGMLHYLPDHEAEPVKPSEETTAEGGEGAAPEPPMAWYLQAESSDAMFKIANVTPSLEFAFRLLEAEDLPFVGGVKIGAAYSYKDRRASRISAPIEVEWLRYANRYLAP